MGLRFRKSINLGPFRATVSKSGVSYSAGSKFGRVTKRADGKTQTTATIPGTGISHVTVSGGSSNSTPGGKAPKKGGKGKIIAVCLAALLAVGCMAGGDEDPQPADPVQPDDAVEEVVVPPAEEIVEEPVEAPAEEPAEAPEETPVEEPAEEPVKEQPAEEKPAEAPVQALIPTSMPEAPAPEASKELPVQAAPEPEPEPEPEPKPAPAPAPKPAPAPAPDPEPEISEPVTAGVIGNINSKVYHELGCGSVAKMKDKNKVPFPSADAARAQGYDPCQNCH